MTWLRIRSFLITFGVGTLVGLTAAASEVLSRRVAVPTDGIVSYGLLGGILAIAARLLLALVDGSRAGLRAIALTILAFGGIEILYFVNVQVLPGEYFLSRRSLLVDAVGIVPLGMIAVLVWRSGYLRQARHRWDGPLAWTSGLTLVVSVTTLFITDYSPAQPREIGGAGPNLLLIVLDSARRDHMGLYGYPRPTSPRIDELKPQSRIYDAAYSAASWTVPSVAALMTGQLDGRGDGPTVAETLRARGYATGFFSDNPHLNRRSSILSGFGTIETSAGTWRWFLRGTVVGSTIERLFPGDDRQLVDHALKFAAQHHGPVLVYAHLMDSHTPYRWPPIDGRRRAVRRIDLIVPGMSVTQAEMEDIVARYDGGILSASDQAFRLLAAARSWGRPYLAIVTADHGESLGEEGRWFHGGSLAPELLAVPLLVLGDGVTPGRSATPVGYAAVRATLLRAGGAPSNSDGDLRTGTAFGVVEGGLPPNMAYRIVDGYKVVIDAQRNVRSLFSLADASEAHDLAKDRPQALRILAEGLSPRPSPSRPLAEVRERLRAIGYVE